MYTVYVLRSRSTGKHYIGFSKNIEDRLKRHNSELTHKKSSYTYKNKGPWIIIYSEVYNIKSEAIKREIFLKSHKGRDWLRVKLNTGR